MVPTSRQPLQVVLHHITIGDKPREQPVAVVTGRVQLGEREVVRAMGR